MSKYDFTIRGEVQPFVPSESSRILDIGCSRGAFGEALKKSRRVEVWGIELDPDDAAEARTRLDRVFVGDACQALASLNDAKFDCITCNDVLEHLAMPEDLLKTVKPMLSSGGCVVASIPNIRYFKALRDILFRADFKYQDDGIFDRTHLRFFTRKGMIRLFEESGYSIVRIEGINKKTNFLIKLLNLLSFNGMEDIQYMQYVVVARPAI